MVFVVTDVLSLFLVFVVVVSSAAVEVVVIISAVVVYCGRHGFVVA